MERHVISKLSKLLNRRASTTIAMSPQQQRQQQMPDCRRWPVLEKLLAFLAFGRNKRLHEFIDKRHQKYGPLFRGSVGPLEAVFVSSPEAIQQIFLREGKTPQNFVPPAWIKYNELRGRKRGLLFMNGDEWYNSRKILNRVMLEKDSGNFMKKPCQEAAERLAEKWNGYLVNNQTVPDLEDQLYQWSIEVVLAAMVGGAWPEYRRRILPRLERMSLRLSEMFDHSVRLAQLPSFLATFILTPSWRGYVAAADEALKSVDTMVQEMLKLEGAEDGLLRRMAQQGVTEEQMFQRLIGDLIVAAGDTTAYSMQWLMFLLASNPEVQDKIVDKLRGLDLDGIVREPYLRCVIKESLRLYPIAPFLMRILQEDILLGGYPVYKGELAVISIYSSSRDESNFPEPNSFDPERWMKNDKGESIGVINHRASLPFAMGARSCIGKKLAEIQMSLTTAELLKYFKIDCLNKKNVTLKLRMISAPSEPLQLRLTPRNRRS